MKATHLPLVKDRCGTLVKEVVVGKPAPAVREYAGGFAG